MINDDIKNYAKQFEYEPLVENAGKLKKLGKFVVVGMGGSHLAADILKTWHPELDIVVWSSYGLPPLHEKDMKDRLVIIPVITHCRNRIRSFTSNGSHTVAMRFIRAQSSAFRRWKTFTWAAPASASFCRSSR